ncbi:hypothetical protein [Bacteroides pyogenes]|uniref:Uncharacterized protein n=1 Tax=Bacteroides pyogenes TaxID=310300 RepID=A0A5D3EB30_9BACE|nr:hypothetical protein [Bacteroides pyogenes]TYK32826.1 hypothetical protein FNJ60_10470 [Bacteroides pyogenes]
MAAFIILGIFLLYFFLRWYECEKKHSHEAEDFQEKNNKEHAVHPPLIIVIKASEDEPSARDIADIYIEQRAIKYSSHVQLTANCPEINFESINFKNLIPYERL